MTRNAPRTGRVRGVRIELRAATLKRGDETAILDLSAAFEPGTITALVGGDGAGKTTLLSTLAHPRGRALLGVTAVSAHDVGVQPAASGVWPNMSVEENLRFVADAQGVRGAERSERIDELLALAGLDAARTRIGAHLSGGMRQKLGAIMAMLHRPGLLLLDEPTTGVDPQARELLGRLFRRAANEGATVILATTYLDEAEAADRVILLDSGRVLAQGSPAAVIALAPGSLWRSPAGSVDLASTGRRVWQRGDSVFEWRPDSALHAEAGVALDADSSLPGAVRAEEDLELATIEFLLDAEGSTGGDATPETATPGSLGHRRPALDLAASDPVVECTSIRKTFGDLTALDGVDLVVRPGEIVGLVGGNGAGKSTLIRLLLGIDTPDAGTVRLFGERPSRRARARLGYVPQALGLYPMLGPSENLAFTQEVFGVPKSQRIRSPLPRVPVGRLPLGARRTLAVDAALSHAPELLVLDEPTSGMDSLSRARLWKRIRRSAQEGVGVLVTTHYRQEAVQCDVLLHLEAGRVVEVRGR